jgi:phosphoglycolate phosphatase
MSAIVALYGYLGDGDRPHDWGAHGFIAEPRALLDWV